MPRWRLPVCSNVDDLNANMPHSRLPCGPVFGAPKAESQEQDSAAIRAQKSKHIPNIPLASFATAYPEILSTPHLRSSGYGGSEARGARLVDTAHIRDGNRYFAFSLVGNINTCSAKT